MGKEQGQKRENLFTSETRDLSNEEALRLRRYDRFRVPGSSPNLAYNIPFQEVIPRYSIIQQPVAAYFNIASVNIDR